MIFKILLSILLSILFSQNYPEIGSAQSLDIITWNIENFPKNNNTIQYVEDIIDNEYVLDIGLGVTIFIIILFLVLMINKGISKAVRYTGIGSLDTIFGFFFGFIRAYIISVCLFSGIHIVYNYNKWAINVDKSYIFPYLEKGSNYLLKEFPDEKTYKESKEKIEDL